MKLADTKYMIICGLLLSMCINSYARIINANGRVVDKYDGEPLIGVSVCISYADRTDSIVAVSDINGLFSISLPENQLLRFRYVGFDDAFAVAKSNMLIEMEDGGSWKNPLWIVDSMIADLYYPGIWYQSPFGDVSLESLVCDAIPILRESDIDSVELTDTTLCVNNILFNGLCRISTRPTTVQVIVDGEDHGIIKEYPGRFAGKSGAINYASNTLQIHRPSLSISVKSRIQTISV